VAIIKAHDNHVKYKEQNGILFDDDDHDTIWSAKMLIFWEKHNGSFQNFWFMPTCVETVILVVMSCRRADVRSAQFSLSSSSSSFLLFIMLAMAML